MPGFHFGYLFLTHSHVFVWFLSGGCDEGCHALAAALGWGEDLQRLESEVFPAGGASQGVGQKSAPSRHSTWNLTEAPFKRTVSFHVK